MALMPQEVPITRDNVHQWLQEWGNLTQENPDYIATWEEYLRSRVKFVNLSDEMVNTSAMDDWEDEAHIVEMILADMPSYA